MNKELKNTNDEIVLSAINHLVQKAEEQNDPISDNTLIVNLYRMIDICKGYMAEDLREYPFEMFEINIGLKLLYDQGLIADFNCKIEDEWGEPAIKIVLK